jgi:hypothetical protein
VSNTASGDGAAIGGGFSNSVSGSWATVGGGFGNIVSADYGTIGGGGRTNNANQSTGNRVTDNYGTVSGGGNNQAGDAAGTITDRPYATVSGGVSNTASGSYATVPGGANNTASGNYSFAAGNGAVADDDGAFVWGDSTPAFLNSPAANSFTIRAAGGIYFYSNGALTAGVTLPAGGGAWAAVSDQALKENLAAVDARAVLDTLVALPISTWNYISQDDAIRHIGVMAQDFYAAFGVGEDERHITTIDADGVAFAAIQGLNAKLESEVETLRAHNAQLEARLAALEGLAGAQHAVPLPFVVIAGLGLLGVALRRRK